MHFRLSWILLVLGLATLSAGCVKDDASFDAGPSDARFSEGGIFCQDPNGDEDGDGIPNSEEGCTTGRDTDHDKIPDWQDFDSDDDGISDSIEKGDPTCPDAKKPGWPCDTDGDGTPDYTDVDSDNDSILDKEEDVNGDGLLGCCLSVCNQPDIKHQKDNCVLNEDGCGGGQTCESGKCTPAIDFHCSNGETNPKLKDTFGDGKLDSERGTYICRDATEDKPKGRKPVQLRKSTIGDWHIALEKTAKYNELTIQGAAEKEAAGVVDEDGMNAEVAGFIISRDTTKEKIQDEYDAILAAINSRVPGGGQGTVSVRATGAQVKSHDKYDTIQGTIIDLSLSSANNVSTVRNELIGTLLGKEMPALGTLPGPYGMSATDFVVKLVTLKRIEFKRDSGKLVLDDKGFPVDSGDQTKWRLIVMGAVAARDAYQNPTRLTGFIVDDLAGGTALAVANDSVGNECDVGTITSLPVADIIWVIDESGSMSEERQNIVNNANNFFSRALASGLDFRMGVAGVCNPSSTYGTCGKVVGKFCSKITTQSDDDGGQDRFLLPTEQNIFSSCINNPPGNEGGSEYGLTNMAEAIKKHLPRQTNAPDKVRPEAKLVVIFATDETPQECKNAKITSESFSTCTLDAAKASAMDSFLKPYLDLISGITDPEAATMVHLIGGVCNPSCDTEVTHGYSELVQATGGQVGDICQKDLGSTLQVIIDSIVGAASPVKLDYVPISSSLAVAMDGVEVPRSRTNGFDYRSSSNSLVFLNVKYKKGSEIIASYKRWERQVDIDKF